MINLIAACDRNRVMGLNGRLPWKIEEDWNYFMQTTQQDPLIMGRKCYNDFKSYAPSKQVIALSRNPFCTFEHAIKASSLDEALAISKKIGEKIWICGGRNLYIESMPIADRLYLTEIDAEFHGDVYFPEWEKVFTKEISRKAISTDNLRLDFCIFSKES